MHNFVVLAFARTGSYRFSEVLNHQDDVICHGELFKKNSVEARKGSVLEKKNISATNRDKNVGEFLDEVYSESGAVGFKIFPNHNPKAFDTILYDQSIKKIFLSRNPIQSYISQLFATKNNQWVLKDEKKRKEHGLVNFSFNGFGKHFLARVQTYWRVSLYSKVYQDKVLFVDYKESLKSEKMQEVYKFIGGDEWLDISSTHKKIIEKEYEYYVDNWGEVKSFMSQFGVDHNMDFFTFVDKIKGKL